MAKLALVTGSGKRIGAAIALGLAEDGHDAIIHYSSSAAAARETAGQIRALGREAWLLQADFTDPDGAVAALDELLAEIDRPLDVMVSSASLFQKDTIETVTRESLEQHLAVNLVTPVLYLSRLVKDRFRDGGLFVQLLDFKLYAPNADFLSYTLSKFAGQGLVQSLARSLAPRLRVCSVSPGYTLPSPSQTAERFESLRHKTPMGFGPDPSHIVQAIRLLVANDALTGVDIPVDAGLRFRGYRRDVVDALDGGDGEGGET